VAARDDHGRQLYRLELATGLRSTRLPIPEVNARLTAYHPATGTSVFVLDGSAGTSLWTGNPERDTRFALRLALNQHLAGAAEGETRTILYRSGDGEYLYARLLLPVGFEEGELYPLITHVYPGVVIPAHGTESGRIYAPSPQHSLQLFAAMGYAVLYPSIPLPPGPAAIDPLLELASNVLPAVEAVVAMGIADPNRLGLYGHSYGGYAALALVTQTRRFHVAIASASFSDLLSYYSQFEITQRYLPFAHEFEQLNMAEWEREDGTIRMRSVPWDDHLRYLRNSPLYHLQRIETPLLLIHGDLDAAPIAQSEAVFMGLYRLGKRARLVRYWGEGHTLDSPANIRDYWERVADWLDLHFNARVGSDGIMSVAR
jgi:dipeptidyl aminopeptidase/acylaminoacyl peptidase